MEEEETKTCPNCKREIPSVNFTTHSIHCARNIAVCPVCKEPVPHTQLDEHHQTLHKLAPCKQCGESVCGTDLEDHVRDSCAHTVQSCRFCSLELGRGALPGHEAYCGARTERCPDCHEYVMHKYRQLHLSSNHGFIRLDDDPVPTKKETVKVTNIPKLSNVANAASNINRHTPSTSRVDLGGSSYTSHGDLRQPEPPRTQIRFLESGAGASVLTSTGDLPPLSSIVSAGGNSSQLESPRQSAQASTTRGYKAPLKRTNDQPQLNTHVPALDKLIKTKPMPRGVVAKKRPAPRVPPVPPADPSRTLLAESALLRQQQEQDQRIAQNKYNLSVGLPPVLSAAEKLEKLRKMDALQNRDVEPDYKNCLNGRVWRTPDHIPLSHVLGTPHDDHTDYFNPRDIQPGPNSRITPSSNSSSNLNSGSQASSSGSSSSSASQSYNSRAGNDFQNVKPMTPEEFMQRFVELQVGGGEGRDVAGNNAGGNDRFSEIKTSLRELRRGLNEVTAPYNSNNAQDNNARRVKKKKQRRNRASEQGEGLPCEFCGELCHPDDLVLHQTGCRPDLAQFRPRSASPAAPPSRDQSPPSPSSEDPVIPCEFCTESLPVYLINEHQVRCSREPNRLFPD